MFSLKVYELSFLELYRIKIESKDLIFDKFCEVLLANRESVDDLTMTLKCFNLFQPSVAFHTETNTV